MGSRENQEVIVLDDSDSEEKEVLPSSVKKGEPKPSTSGSLSNQLSKPSPSLKHNTSNGMMSPEKRQKYEQCFVKYMGKIDEIDSQEVNWDDEQNSAYVMKDRLTKKLMKCYQLFCKKTGYDGVMTGRPMQKKFLVEKVTRFPEIDKAVEKFLNKFLNPRVKVGDKNQVSYSAPEYNDIVDVVKAEIEKSGLLVLQNEVDTMAQDLFRYTIKSYKKRRSCELRTVALPALSGTLDEDPADTDAELRKKLDENRKKGRKEGDVFREYAEKQKEMPGGVDLIDDDEEEDEEESSAEDEEEPEEFLELPSDSPPPPLAKKMKKDNSD